MAEMAKTPWRIVGEEVATCNCAWGCPCQFNALPTHGRCEALVGVRIHEGSHADKAQWTRCLRRCGGSPALFTRAGPLRGPQSTSAPHPPALLNIVSGKDGGMPFEIFAAVTETFLDPLFVPIQFETNRDTRIATLKAPGLGEFRTEPIKNPVTSEEHRALIRLPNGFEYKEAEMGNATMMHAVLGDKTLSHENTYAQLAAVEWGNS